MIMCGIIGYTGDRDAADLILAGLKQLEYRGYDSSGLVVLGDDMQIRKDAREIGELEEEHNIFEMDGSTGIGHTRWATHGGVTQENAHPHTCCTGRVAIVHNGIVENYEDLQDELDQHDFSSETDSEVIAHFLGDRLEDGARLQDAVEELMGCIEGTFAVVALDRETGTLTGFKRGSPLSVGVAGTEYFIGSDVHAFLDHTNEVVFLHEDEYVIIEESPEFYRYGQGEIDKTPETVEQGRFDTGKGDHDHHMLKEIHEQPEALHRLRQTLEHGQASQLDRFADMVADHEKVIFTAAGTSYHAALLGVYYLQKAGVEAQALIASEFQNYERVDDDTLLVAVSQSGETRDTLDAIDYSQDRGATIAAVTNTPHSAIQREADVSIDIHAGKEVCVAATKTYTNTVYALLHLAERCGYDAALDGIADNLQYLIEENEERTASLAEDLANEDDMYVIGRGATYPVSREIALKLKEIPYVHAEGMMGGELKHGTLALIEEDTPVFALVPEEDDAIVSNVHEVEARGGNVISVSPYQGMFDVPDGIDGFPFYATTLGFLLSYYLGVERGCPIDKPRNLAKTVTVR